MSTKIHTPLGFAATIAGRYTIVRELGRGGMATVYLATDTTTNRQVAVKVLHPDLAASIGGERFLREIELGKLLGHPHIVSVLDSGEAAGQLYYTMPYVEGESLRDRLDRQRQLTIDETLSITRQVAEALDFAHGRGVVHRDIKPENILLSGDTAFVMDFGIAHAVTTAGGEKLTKTGMAVGTPAYMSPEQAVGAKDVTAHSDVYSLGCVVYEMLAGEPPFAGANAMALLAKHSLESVPSIRVVRAAVPEQLEDAIFCALEKTPVDRFPSVGDFAKALAGEIKVPKHTKNRTAAGMRAVPAPRSRTPLIAAAAVVLLCAGAGGWWFMQRGGADEAARRAGTDTDPTHIAVLYFEDGSPKKDLGFLADGLTEALIHELSAVKQLRVISRNGVAQLKGKTLLADSVGKTLKVGTVVTGKISQAGDKLRLDVSLVDALDNQEIGSTQIDQPRDSVIALQDQLAEEVATQLRRKLGQEQLALRSRGGTRNTKAWEAFQRARETMDDAAELNRAKNPKGAMEQLDAADVELAAAEKLDGKWTQPIIQRGWAAYQQSRIAPNVDPSLIPALVQKGIAHAERALALTPGDADALELRGTLRWWGWLRNVADDPATMKTLVDGAEDDLTSATKANPMQAGAWNVLSHYWLRKATPSKAKLSADRALEADPYLVDVHQTIWRRFQASLDLGNYEDAKKACESGARRFPENFHFRFNECSLWLHAMNAPTKPNPADIWRDYDAFVKASPPSVQAFHALKGKMMVALGLVKAGMADSARSLAETTQLAATADPEKELLYLRAVVQAQLAADAANPRRDKDKEEAIRILSRFLAGSPQASDGGSADESWWMDALKSDPKYKALTGQ